MTPPRKTRYVVRDIDTGDYTYHGWCDEAAALAATPGTVFGAGNTFTEAEAQATYRMCRQRERGNNQ